MCPPPTSAQTASALAAEGWFGQEISRMSHNVVMAYSYSVSSDCDLDAFGITSWWVDG